MFVGVICHDLCFAKGLDVLVCTASSPPCPFSVLHSPLRPLSHKPNLPMGRKDGCETREENILSATWEIEKAKKKNKNRKERI